MYKLTSIIYQKTNSLSQNWADHTVTSSCEDVNMNQWFLSLHSRCSKLYTTRTTQTSRKIFIKTNNKCTPNIVMLTFLIMFLDSKVPSRALLAVPLQGSLVDGQFLEVELNFSLDLHILLSLLGKLISGRICFLFLKIP